MAGIKIDDLPAVAVPALTDVFPIDQGAVTYKEDLSQVLSLFKTNGEALTRVNDTNVTVTLGGSPSIALFNATSLTMGWAGQLAVPRGGTGNSTFTPYSVICAGTNATGAFQNVSGVGASGEVLTSNGAGALPTWQANASGTVTSISAGTGITLTPNPITTTGSVALTVPVTEVLGGTNQTTYTLGDTLYASAANTLSKLAGNTTTAKQYLSQTGNGAVSAAPAWATIDGGDITGAALTRVDDTNVTLTLGGTPTTALLRATSITAGWAGQLSLARGGTNANLTASDGGIFYSTATAGAILAGTATAGQILRSGASAAPSWSTATYPATAGTSGNVLTSDGTNWSSAAPAASATSVIADDTTTNATMYPVWVTANTGSLPLKVSSTKLSFNPSTATLTLAGPMQSVTSVKDSNGNIVNTFVGVGSATDYLTFTNSTGTAPTAGPIIGVDGSNTNMNLDFQVKGTAAYQFLATTTSPSIIRMYEQTTNGTNYVGIKAAASLAGNQDWEWPGADGSANFIMKTNGSAVLSFANGSQVAGTATNDSASAGNIGELLSSTFSGTTVTGNTDVASLTLTPGDWDIYGNATFVGSTAGVWTSNFLGYSTVSATYGNPDTYIGDNSVGFGTNSTQGYIMPGAPIKVASNTTYYMIAQCNHTTGTVAAYGGFYARRRR